MSCDVIIDVIRYHKISLHCTNDVRKVKLVDYTNHVLTPFFLYKRSQTPLPTRWVILYKRKIELPVK